MKTKNACLMQHFFLLWKERFRLKLILLDKRQMYIFKFILLINVYQVKIIIQD